MECRRGVGKGEAQKDVVIPSDPYEQDLEGKNAGTNEK